MELRDVFVAISCGVGFLNAVWAVWSWLKITYEHKCYFDIPSRFVRGQNCLGRVQIAYPSRTGIAVTEVKALLKSPDNGNWKLEMGERDKDGFYPIRLHLGLQNQVTDSESVDLTLSVAWKIEQIPSFLNWLNPSQDSILFELHPLNDDNKRLSYHEITIPDSERDKLYQSPKPA